MQAEKYLDAIDNFLTKDDWRVTENSNAHYSFGALNKFITGLLSEDYWKKRVYNEAIKNAHEKGYIHIHDLGILSIYCCGYSLTDIILKGVVGVSNISESTPAKHFMSILNQVANLVTVYQNEIAGAVAFSSFDTLLAPFVKEDRLTYDEVYQHMQNFIFAINSNSRGGSEPSFSNLTFDLTPPKDLLDKYVIVGGETLGYRYRDCQHEMNMINKAFYEIMLKGDAKGAPHAYPIPTYNIHERFNWDHPNNELLWEMAGKYGIPYFANFIGSDMDPSEARSMCCRLRLDKRELVRRGGGLFGASDKTGSIGVVTLNLPRLAYLSKDKEEFYKYVDEYMEIGKDSLEIKRVFLQEQLDRGLLPAYSEYVGHLNNHFSTIGYVGLNEACMNLLGKDITDKDSHKFSSDLLEYMRDKLRDYQEETGNLYNLEATPAESTCYRLAKIDKEEFTDIYTQSNNGEPYYTNSCHLPVNMVENITQLLDHQEELQVKHTGGTVVHLYLETSITGKKAKHIVKTVCNKYKIPYISLSPVYSVCPNHKFLTGYHDECPYCGEKTESYQRVTGYIRQVSKFNPGKKAEFRDRAQLGVSNDML